MNYGFFKFGLNQHRSGDSSFYLWDGIRNVRQLTHPARQDTGVRRVGETAAKSPSLSE